MIMNIISSEDLVALNWFQDDFPIWVDLVYADAHHPENVFQTAFYNKQALMLAHIDLAAVTLLAASRLFESYGWKLALKDCLRPVEAQKHMGETALVKANPQWLEEPRFLSPPGMGGHPRGMAIDIAPINQAGQSIDMGTGFDAFYNTTEASLNPAHRYYPHHVPQVVTDRARLEKAMTGAAADLGLPMLPLPQEWWDFRFPASYSQHFAPIDDSALPAHLQIIKQREVNGKHDAELAAKARDKVKGKLSRFI